MAKARTKDVGTRRPMPLEIRPMMAQSSAQPFDDPEWIFEMKWDGYRALATIDSGHVNLWSRNGLRLDSKYPLIVQELENLKLKNAILDGEIVALDADGIPRFGQARDFKKALTERGIHSVRRRHRRPGHRVLPCGARTRSGGHHGETKRKPVFARAPVGKLAQNQGQNAARGCNRRHH
jgi:hypothetical protein